MTLRPNVRPFNGRPPRNKVFLWLVAVGSAVLVAVLGCDLGHNPILPAAGDDSADGGFVDGGDGSLDGGDSGAPPSGAGGDNGCATILGAAGHGGAAGSAGSASISSCSSILK